MTKKKNNRHTPEPEASQSQPAPRSWTLLHLAVIALLGFAIYANTLHAPFVFDDVPYIVNNPALRDLRYFTQPALAEQAIANNLLDVNFNTRSLVFLSLALNYALQGLEVEGYHLVNILIHIGNGWLVYLLLQTTLETPFFAAGKRREKHLAPLFAALLFISHPLQTQAVTYTCQRFASLATLFCLASLLLYLRARLAPVAANTTPGWRFWLPYTLSLVAALLAMKCKEIAFTFPLVIALHEFLFLAEAQGKRLLALIPHLLAMLLIPLTILAARGQFEDLGRLANSLHGPAENPAWSYLLSQFGVIVTYLRLLLLPLGQNLDYDYQPARGFFQPGVILPLLLLLALLGMAIHFSRRENRPPHGPWPRLAAFGLLWFFLTLAVESSFLPLQDLIFEHRLYLPSVGLFFSAIALVELLQIRLGHPRPAWGMAFLTLLVAAWGATAMARNAVWGDALQLWQDNVAKSPGKPRPQTHLGKAYLNLGRHREAVAAYGAALALDPTLGYAYFNRGLAYFQLGQLENALRDYNTTLTSQPARSTLHQAETVLQSAVYLNRGLAFHKLGQWERALADYDAGLRSQPSPELAGRIYSNRGALFYAKRELARALADFNQAIAANPESVEGFRNRGLILEEQGQLAAAIADYSHVLALRPEMAEIYLDRGRLYRQSGQGSLARQDFATACRLGSSAGCQEKLPAGQ